ncbi:hypothetical protein EPICR_190032 [Candidatus Desulfarcum epimagneticum]|uniref:Uncharacterized protein n=1 Tax=uncultured Desulfobacteraceae bacterium TaxID=218296 RepID=A0A484HIW8_9BACT|nr:hypothetical protein EPICR_190032 [uncultured Desulfobacteraceae bacterium]
MDSDLHKALAIRAMRENIKGNSRAIRGLPARALHREEMKYNQTAKL